MLCHLPGLLQEMGSVKSFTGQGMYIIVCYSIASSVTYTMQKYLYSRITSSIDQKYHTFNPPVINIFKSLLFFLCHFAGVEKKNDDMRKYFQRKCNRWDSCRQILLVEKRMEVLEHEGCAREHRSYQKRDITYWEQGKSLVAKNAVKNFTASHTLFTQQVDVQESQQPEGNSDSTASNSSHQNNESYTLSDLKKLRKKELAAIFEMKLGEPPSKKNKRVDIISDIMAWQNGHITTSRIQLK